MDKAKLAEIHMKIVNDATDDDIASIMSMCKQRWQILKYKALGEIEIGARVELRNISPKYMAGRIGTVVRKKQTKFVVRMDDPMPHRFYGTPNNEIVVPAGSLKVLEPVVDPLSR